MDAHNEKKMELVGPGEKKCREQRQEDYRRTRWNNSTMVLGFAPSWISMAGNTSDLKWNGGALRTSFAYGFENVPGLEDSSQLILHYRYRNKEQLPDPMAAGKFLEQDSNVVGVRWRIGNANATGSFEYVFLLRDIVGKPSDNSSRLSIGAERRITGNIWFGLSFGTERGRDDGANRAFVLTSFNSGFNQRTD